MLNSMYIILEDNAKQYAYYSILEDNAKQYVYYTRG